jgi:hypothetical protein
MTKIAQGPAIGHRPLAGQAQFVVVEMEVEVEMEMMAIMP